MTALFAPVPAASVAFFRVAFGLLMIWHLKPFLLAADGVQIFTGPAILFKFYGFEWVQPGPDWALRLLFWALAAAALCISLGLYYRIATAVFFAGYTYVFLLDRALANNHNYLICLLALALAVIPAHGFASIDARRQRRWRSPTLPAWTLWLLRFLLGLPYFFGGVAKINHDWLFDAQPMRLWLATGAAGGSLPAAFRSEPWLAYFLSWGGLAFDLLVVPFLLWRRTRIPAFLCALSFHLMNSQLFTIGVFPWLMICATTLFFDPDWPLRRGLFKDRRGSAKPKAAPVPAGRQRLTMALLATFVAVQILLPFRHLLYPGNVDWTVEGHHFAWRMKIHDKTGSVRFAVVDRQTQKAQVFSDLSSVLTPRQHQRLITDPFLILQFAHHLARRLQAQGATDFEVRALTSVSFNGRRPKPLIDPQADLAAETDSLLPADWILPLEE